MNQNQKTDYQKYKAIQKEYGFKKAISYWNPSGSLEYDFNEFLRDPKVVRRLYKNDHDMISKLDEFEILRRKLKDEMGWLKSRLFL